MNLNKIQVENLIFQNQTQKHIYVETVKSVDYQKMSGICINNLT
jgi:hypothetical protein